MKRWLQKKTRLWLAAGLAGAFGLVAQDGSARPQKFVPDPITGYALAGHDPVSYFVDGRPRPGSREHMVFWGGVEWIFVNEGNLAAFKRDPQAYAPLFAGCGGYALSDGFASAGNPFIYAVINGRLVLFHSVVNRFLFVVGSAQRAEEAARQADTVGCVADQ